MASLNQRLNEAEPQILARAGQLENSIYGIVDRVIDGIPNCIRKWKGTIGNMVPTDEEPTIFVIEKLEPIILKHKKYKCLFGGRAGTKSMVGMDCMAGDVNSNGSKVYVLRETMKSLKNSIYAGIESRIKQLNLSGFSPTPSQWEIKHNTGGVLSFGGMANIRDIKSSFEYKYIFLEEADQTSQKTLDTLGPTLRGVEGAEMWLIWNPASSADAMSQQFIVPYQDDIDRQGYYEDEYRLIIKVGFEDNPWFMADESLRIEYEMNLVDVKMKRMTQARFDWIWHGAFNDDVENSLIESDWFDACIDAHITLGAMDMLKGAKVATHDPSDVGKDAKGYALREGRVLTDIAELDAVDGNEACDMACSRAIDSGADVFGWDCDGMGALLRKQVAASFSGKKVKTYMFKGSESPHDKDSVFDDTKQFGMQEGKEEPKTVGDVLRNKRSQNYVNVAIACKKTWEAVTQGKYHDPSEMISFSSEIPSKVRAKLKAELCRMPLKPNGQGMIQLYMKDEMRKGILMPDGSKLVLPSPNLGDCVMMSLDKEAKPALKIDRTPINYPADYGVI